MQVRRRSVTRARGPTETMRQPGSGRSWSWLIGLALLGVGLSASVLGQAATALAATQGPATVARVIDGDTVDVQFDDGSRERVRLIGIDTPEVVAPRKPVHCFGREASAYAHTLLDGQAVTVEADRSQGTRDRYGRLLGYLRLPDGRDFGEVMIGD